MDGAHRQAAGKCIAQKYDRRIGGEHAAGGAGDDGRKVRVTGGERDRCDLRLVANLRDEKSGRLGGS